MTRNQNHDDASSRKTIKTCDDWSDLEQYCSKFLNSQSQSGLAMAKANSVIIYENHDDACSRKTIETCDAWSDLTNDVLLLVMMQLGVVDFLAFSGVCKSWRSLAICNRNTFIVSRPPMSISVPIGANEQEYCLEDFIGRKFKTIVPHSAGRRCIGVTGGYFILGGEKTNDFWLVNLMTRHEIHFPDVPVDVFCHPGFARAILVFSHSIGCLVFVVLNVSTSTIWFLIAGKREWTKFPTRFFICDVHAFKGKIYTLHFVHPSDQVGLCEMTLYPEPKLVLLETERFPKPDFRRPGFVSCSENLYVMDRTLKHLPKIHEIDFCKMKWVSPEKTGKKLSFFFSYLKLDVVVIRPESWAHIHTDNDGKGRVFCARLWYFFHDCFNVNLIHE